MINVGFIPPDRTSKKLLKSLDPENYKKGQRDGDTAGEGVGGGSPDAEPVTITEAKGGMCICEKRRRKVRMVSPRVFWESKKQGAVQK